MIKDINVIKETGNIESDYYALELTVESRVMESVGLPEEKLVFRLPENQYFRLKHPEEIMEYIRFLLLSSILCDGNCYDCTNGEQCDESRELSKALKDYKNYPDEF